MYLYTINGAQFKTQNARGVTLAAANSTVFAAWLTPAERQAIWHATARRVDLFEFCADYATITRCKIDGRRAEYRGLPYVSVRDVLEAAAVHPLFVPALKRLIAPTNVVKG